MGKKYSICSSNYTGRGKDMTKHNIGKLQNKNAGIFKLQNKNAGICIRTELPTQGA